MSNYITQYENNILKYNKGTTFNTSYLGLGSLISVDSFDVIVFIPDEFYSCSCSYNVNCYHIFNKEEGLAGGSVAFTSKLLSPCDFKSITLGFGGCSNKKGQTKTNFTTLQTVRISLVAYSHTY